MRTTVAKHLNCGRARGARGAHDRRLKHVDVDFGTYHHSTPTESNEIRERIEKAFAKVLPSFYPSGAALLVLDAGCGLGFLTYVAAKCYPEARVTGVDLFRHGSISGISMEKAANNMRSLGVPAR